MTHSNVRCLKMTKRKIIKQGIGIEKEKKKMKKKKGKEKKEKKKKKTEKIWILPLPKNSFQAEYKRQTTMKRNLNGCSWITASVPFQIKS